MENIYILMIVCIFKYPEEFLFYCWLVWLIFEVSFAQQSFLGISTPSRLLHWHWGWSLQEGFLRPQWFFNVPIDLRRARHFYVIIRVTESQVFTPCNLCSLAWIWTTDLGHKRRTSLHYAAPTCFQYEDNMFSVWRQLYYLICSVAWSNVFFKSACTPPITSTS